MQVLGSGTQRTMLGLKACASAPTDSILEVSKSQAQGNGNISFRCPRIKCPTLALTSGAQVLAESEQNSCQDSEVVPSENRQLTADTPDSSQDVSSCILSVWPPILITHCFVSNL